jgi:BirA family transcriptional regulator, biotin operon repressor / biotin---[acetyl-CoA-carboxylase] ligase
MSLNRPGQEARFSVLRVTRVARTRSTQDLVLEAARAGAGEGFCCIADEQSAGRGRQGRAWVAPAASALLASVLLRRSPTVAVGIPFAAGLAVVDSLVTACGVTATLKWPNDVLLDGRKLAGILSEVEPGSSGTAEVAVALGVGLNLSVIDFPSDVAGISLHEVCDGLPGAEVLLQAWWNALGVWIAALEEGGIAAITGAWRRHATGLPAPVTVQTATRTLEGTALDIADDGALLVESGGEVHRVLAGDVHLGSSVVP